MSQWPHSVNNVVPMPAASAEAQRLQFNGWLSEHPECGLAPISREEWAKYSPIAEALRCGTWKSKR